MLAGFGKYRDKEVSEIPLEYLQYISGRGWFVSVALPVRKAICERLGIPLIERPNPYRKNYGHIARGKGIMDRNFKRTLDFDDFNDSKNNNS